MKIIIKVPKGKEKWKVNRRHRANVNTALKLTERLINEAASEEKTCVKVIYDDGYNETLKSQDANYLLYATACFLEDHLSKASLRKVERNYLK